MRLLCFALEIATVNKTFLSPHSSVLKGFTEKGQRFWYVTLILTHRDTITDTHVHNDQQTPRDHGCQLFNKAHPPLKYKGYQINHIHTPNHTRARTAWHVIDVQLWGHGVPMPVLKQKKKERSAPLNYFLLIWSSACSSNYTHGHAAVL